MACSCRCTCKLFVWTWWVIHAFLAVLYSGLSLTTFTKLISGTGRIDTNAWDSSVIDFEPYRAGLLGAAFISFMIVVFSALFTLMVLVSRVFADIKLAYGINVGTTFHTSWVLLLSGIVLQTSTPLADWFHSEGVWSKRDTQTYRATYVLGYVLVVHAWLSSLVLLIGRKSLGRRELESIDDGTATLNTSTAPSNAYVDMTTLPTSTKPTTAPGRFSFSRNNQV